MYLRDKSRVSRRSLVESEVDDGTAMMMGAVERWIKVREHTIFKSGKNKGFQPSHVPQNFIIVYNFYNSILPEKRNGSQAVSRTWRKSPKWRKLKFILSFFFCKSRDTGNSEPQITRSTIPNTTHKILANERYVTTVGQRRHEIFKSAS